MNYKFIIFLIWMSAANMANAQLYLQSSATITTTGNAIISLQHTSLQNNGTITQAATGKFVFNGAANDSITGSGTTTFDTLEIAKTNAAKLALSSPNITAGDGVLFTSGLIDLTTNSLLLLPTAKVVNETETSHFVGSNGGSVQISNITATGLPALYNAGNLGAAITTSANMGTLGVLRSPFPSSNVGNAGKTGIQRTFFIQPQNNTALNAMLRFYYLDAELNGKDESTLALWKSDNGISWTMIGADNRDAVNNYVEKTGIASFSYWTLTDATSVLPITLLNFKATCENDGAFLQWQTSSEINAADFIVQKSTDASTWLNLQTITATNITNGATYFYKDVSPSSTAYYRLKMVDKDGSFSYSPVFNGGCIGAAMPFVVYPNPAHAMATARLSVRQAGKAVIYLYGINGQLISQHDWALQIGINSFAFPAIAMLPAGSYVVKVLLNGETLQTKLVKE